MSGAPLGTSHSEAILETEISPQNSTDTVISNPLGFYVTRLSWAEQHRSRGNGLDRWWPSQWRRTPSLTWRSCDFGI